MLSAILDRLGVDRVILVGHSWGGLLALTFALDYPHRVAGLVVIAPPTHPWLGQTKWLYSVFAIPVFGWVFAHTLTLPFGALLIGPGFRGAFLPQSPPPGYMKRWPHGCCCDRRRCLRMLPISPGSNNPQAASRAL